MQEKYPYYPAVKEAEETFKKISLIVNGAVNKKAIEKFLNITHDRYFETVGDEFGKTVPAIFTDEPQFTRKGTLSFAESKSNVPLPWTDDLEETYKAAYGDSLIDHLPELLWDLPDGQVLVCNTFSYLDEKTIKSRTKIAVEAYHKMKENGIL